MDNLFWIEPTDEDVAFFMVKDYYTNGTLQLVVARPHLSGILNEVQDAYDAVFGDMSVRSLEQTEVFNHNIKRQKAIWARFMEIRNAQATREGLCA